MTVPTLFSLFPKPEDLLALTPEDLGGVIIELMPPLLQNGMFNPAVLIASLFQIVGPSPSAKMSLNQEVSFKISGRESI